MQAPGAPDQLLLRASGHLRGREAAVAGGRASQQSRGSTASGSAAMHTNVAISCTKRRSAPARAAHSQVPCPSSKYPSTPSRHIWAQQAETSEHSRMLSHFQVPSATAASLAEAHASCPALFASKYSPAGRGGGAARACRVELIWGAMQVLSRLAAPAGMPGVGCTAAARHSRGVHTHHTQAMPALQPSGSPHFWAASSIAAAGRGGGWCSG